ncbi:MAG: hypothetical protein QOG48_452 [Verrucomicrobiota bacterium]
MKSHIVRTALGTIVCTAVIAGYAVAGSHGHRHHPQHASGPGFSSEDNPGLYGRTAKDEHKDFFNRDKNPGVQGSAFGKATATDAKSHMDTAGTLLNTRDSSSWTQSARGADHRPSVVPSATPSRGVSPIPSVAPHGIPSPFPTPQGTVPPKPNPIPSASPGAHDDYEIEAESDASHAVSPIPSATPGGSPHPPEVIPSATPGGSPHPPYPIPSASPGGSHH